MDFDEAGLSDHNKDSDIDTNRGHDEDPAATSGSGYRTLEILVVSIFLLEVPVD